MRSFDDIIGGDATLRVVGSRTSTLGEFATEILGDAPTEILGDDESGAFLYKLNPAYWFKSSRERKLVDVEKKARENVSDQAKFEKSRQKELAQAEKAKAAVDAAKAAQAQSDATENRLKEIEEAVSGSMSMMGADVPEPVKERAAEQVLAAHQGQVAAQKNSRRAGSIIAKIEAGEKLDESDIARLKSCLHLCRALRKFHDDLHAQASKTVAATTSGYRGPDGVEKTAPSADFLGSDDLVGGSIPKKRWIAMAAIAASAPPVVLQRYMKQHKISLSATQKGHLSKMAALTKRAAIKKGVIAGDEDMIGLSVWGAIKKTATIATLPLAAAAYLTYKGTEYTAKGLKRGAQAVGLPGFRKGSQSPAAARANRIKAARARQLAAQKRQQAAAAESDAARAEAQAQADAADAEAAAAQAEAEAQDAAAQAQEPAEGVAPDEGDADASEGDFVGGTSVVGADEFMGDWLVGVDPKHKKLVAAAASDTKTGKKIRAGATVVKAARKGNPKAQKAIVKVAAKAKTGDPQAKRDLIAIKAGDKALKAKSKAQKKVAAKKAADARNARGVATRKKFEAAVANRLARGTRKKKLVKIAKVEHKAAHGDRKAKAAIAHTVAKAKTGDKKAKTTVAALQLARRTRLASKTPREHKNLVAASKLVRHARAGNKKAIKQVRIVQAAAAKGQPNAKRAVARMKTAAALERAVATGKVVPPPKKLSTAEKKAASQRKYAHFKKRALSPNGTREEAIAAAREAQKLGDKDAAGKLALLARTKPSATVDLKNAATMAAASKQGDKDAKQVVAVALEEAEKGNPAGIKSAGNLAAVHALGEVKAGRPLPPQIAEGVNTVRAAQAGDPEAKRIVERASASAEDGNANGVAAAVALTAGASLLAATASRPAARAQLVDKANEAQGLKVLPADKQATQAELGEIYAKVQRGEATRAEAERGRKLALGLGNARLAAEISTLMPPIDHGDPRSSMPDEPLPAITGAGSLFKEALKALFFATKDPLANYREGIQSRGSRPLGPPKA